MGRRELSPEQQAQLKAQMTAQLEALIGEQVLAFGFFGYPDFLGSGYRSQADPGDSLFKWFRGRRKTGGMPTMVYVAVTPTRIVTASYSAGMSGVTPKKVLYAWDRSTTEVGVEERLADADPTITGARLTVRPAGEERAFELESFDRGSDVNDQVLALLRQ